MEDVYDFLYEANNVYRTKHYIVKQIIGVRCSEQENNVIFSFDTFYRRTAKRDKAYEKRFRERKNVNGRRLPTTMYARTYIE